MKDFMLRASSENQCNQAMISSGIAVQETDHEGIASIIAVDGVQIDRIGPCGADTRYHVNVRIADGVAYDADELPTFTPLPVTPYRVWFDG
jgi:hypothetical protein